MKKVILSFAAVLLASSSTALYAQSELDAYKYSQTDLSGTARYVGMAGAFGALGGDISSMSSNPGGLAIYRSSEVVATLGIKTADAKTSWTGIDTKDNKTKFNFDNIAYVGYFPTANESGIMGWNVGFSYNRAKNYNRSYRMFGTNLPHSLADYIADVTSDFVIKNKIPLDDLKMGTQESPYDPYSQSGAPWLSVLGYQGGLIDAPKGSSGNYIGNYTSTMAGGIANANLFVNERGSIDKYNFSFATNISNIAFVGASLAISDLSYHINTSYREDFETGDNLYLGNALKTEGTGYGFNVGVIVRPADFLRLGVAYNSKTWYKMTNYFEGEASSFVNEQGQGKMDAQTPRGAYYDYEFSTPDKWIFSAAAIIGQNALISVDYEMSDYGNMKFKDADGVETIDDQAENNLISEDFKIAHTVRVGAEVKVLPQFAIRAGVAVMTTPMKKYLRDGAAEVYTAGTIPNYTVDKGNTTYFTVGLGYRFTPNFYADLACVYKTYKENVYPFSNVEPVTPNDYIIPGTLKNNDTKVVLTLGYKF